MRHARSIVACGWIALLLSAVPAHALRVGVWNITQYPGLSLAARQPHFRTVIPALNVDLLLVQELNSIAGRDSFLTNVLNVVEPGEWAASAPISLGAGEFGTIFYKTAKVSLPTTGSVSTGGPRAVYFAVVQPTGYVSSEAWFRAYSVHFKAGGPGTADSTIRRNECTSFRTTLNNTFTGVVGVNFLIGGDTNFYGGNEGGYQRLVESQLDNDGRAKDPLVPLYITGTQTWHDNSGYGLRMTQCPCNSTCPAGFAGGGMDDRFDLFLTSLSMQDGEGLDYAEQSLAGVASGAYPWTFANDGQHFNTDINGGGFNNAVGLTVATALNQASDHLPIVMVIQLPAKFSAPTALDLGTVIVGGGGTLSISNPAVPPADELTLTFTPPAGFTAPVGSQSVDAGLSGNFTIATDPGPFGPRSGDLTIVADDPDQPNPIVSLSVDVLDHAAASLDSTSSLLASLVDFGQHETGQFAAQDVRVHNRDFDVLQARLVVSGAVITGGDGRFSIVGGFAPALLAETGRTYAVSFNDVGATQDSTYEATLTFSSADEVLPGATPQPDLVVTLRARPASGTTAVGPEHPAGLMFYPPSPNPLRGETYLGFDLPNRAPVDLAIFDLSGRRVARLASGTLEADRYRLRWNARDDHGADVPAGLYFARFETPGLARTARLIVLP